MRRDKIKIGSSAKFYKKLSKRVDEIFGTDAYSRTQEAWDALREYEYLFSTDFVTAHKVAQKLTLSQEHLSDFLAIVERALDQRKDLYDETLSRLAIAVDTNSMAEAQRIARQDAEVVELKKDCNAIKSFLSVLKALNKKVEMAAESAMGIYSDSYNKLIGRKFEC